jgi:hypothetical protein
MTGAGRPAGRRPRRAAFALAVGLDAFVAIAAVVALANGAPAFVIAVAVILGIAPWAAIIDEQERPRRR